MGTVLAAVGLPCDKFAGHSFCIGAATTGARAGIEDSKIYPRELCSSRDVGTKLQVVRLNFNGWLMAYSAKRTEISTVI